MVSDTSTNPELPAPLSHISGHLSAQLIESVQELSLARDLETVVTIVRHGARKLTGADGATFVLRDGDESYYVDEDAIAPLWKGSRFPLQQCVSGQAMLSGMPIIIPDIYADSRVPINLYAKTFVRSLLMVPIRRKAPIGAIGIYWAEHYNPTVEQVTALQALANSTSVALENLRLMSELQERLSDLQKSNHELNRFTWIASHDMREPLRVITSHIQFLAQQVDTDQRPEVARSIRFVVEGAARLDALVLDTLAHAQARTSDHLIEVSAQEAFETACENLQVLIRERSAQVLSSELPTVRGQPLLLTQVFQNLISNALKFQPPGQVPIVEVRATQQGRNHLFSISDNGIGIEPKYSRKIFDYFERLHPQSLYPGSGIGLATCRKILEGLGGEIWVESIADGGSTFSFTVPM